MGELGQVGEGIEGIDVVIVGGGVIGTAIALELARRGTRARVVDRNGEVGHGSTSASCGIVRRFYSTPTMTAMAQEGAERWANWRAYLGGGAGATDDLARFERPGMLFVPPAIDERVHSIVAHMTAMGIEVEILSAGEVARRFPFLDTASQAPIRRPGDEDFFEPTGRTIAGAVFEHGAGYVVSPTQAAHDLRVAAEAAGATFALGRAVTAIEPGTSRRFHLELERGAPLEADVVVNAAGPHSTVINRLAGVELPIEVRPLRREVCAVRNPLFDEARGSPVPVVGDVDSGIYLRPEAGGRDLIVGSLDPECDTPEWIDDPDHFDPRCSPEGFERQVMRAMKRLPDLELGPRRGVVGLYDVTLLDWNPVLDRTDREGFYVAMGTSGSSFKTAPVIGSVLAQLVEACEGGRDHDRDPLVVTLERTGLQVDLSFFSRLRGAHVSSGTVLG